MDKEKIRNHFGSDWLPFFRRYLKGDNQPKKNGRQLTARCPIHGEKNASLSIDPAKGLFHCFGCKAKGDVFHFYGALHKLDIVNDFNQIVTAIARDFGISNNGHGKPSPPIVLTPPDKKPFTHPTLGPATEEYPYTDENGNVLSYNCRFQITPTEKEFRQCSPEGKWSTNGIPRTLYHMERLRDAPTVCIVEGEKDVHALESIGYSATTNVNGGGSWTEADAQLIGKRNEILIFEDNDDTGRKRTRRILETLNGNAETVKVIRFEDKPEHYDISDFLESCADKEEAEERLAMIVEATEPCEPIAIEPECKSPPSPPQKAEMRITLEELSRANITPDCIVKNYLYCDVGSLTAPGGTGKTTLMLFEMACIVLARPLYGLDVLKPGWCCYVTAEDTREILIARLREIMKAMELSEPEQRIVMENVLIWDVTGEPANLISARDRNIELTKLPDEIINAYKSDPPVMMVFDPIISFGVSESLVNDNENWLVTAGRRIMKNLGCCVRYITHTGKANARNKQLDQYTSRGGSALPDGGRMSAVMQSWQPNDKLTLPPGLSYSNESSITILARPKLSYAPPNLPNIWIKRTGWSFEHTVEIHTSPEEQEKALLDQVERFIANQVKSEIYHSKSSLQTALMKCNMARETVRNTTDLLLAHGRVLWADLPKELRQGGKQKYLTTTDLAKNQKNDGEVV